MATNNVPIPESYQQLLSDILSSYSASLGVNDYNVGGVFLSFAEVVALYTSRVAGDIFQVLRDNSVDRATGAALQLLAQEYNITPIVAAPAVGYVDVIDTSFTKISTKIYAGTPAPNIGSTIINVSDASLFPASGSVYIGRGTNDIEGPIVYSVAPVQVGSYWQITLSAPTTKYHNLGESVILAQGGNRSVPANTIVISPGVGGTANIQYSVVTTAIILDGETEVDNVQVAALIPGSAGNVPAGTITQFAAAPFSGATVTNPLPFTTGADTETDDQLRVQIKLAEASTGLGTATAIQAALIGATAVEPNGQSDTIVSDSLMNNINGSATVFIDDGTGYEETSTGVGLESIINSALGGEDFFQLQTGGSQAPVAKAFLESTLSAPFDLKGGDTLAVIVGEITYQHTFLNSDFLSPGGATAYEVTASINADPTLGFSATTAGGGIYVVISAIAETNDTIQVTIPTITSGRNAAVQLGFPSNAVETLRLYKNNIPLTKDGLTASVFTQAQQLWSSTITSGDTLILYVDGTAPTDGQPSYTATITNADFIATGLYTVVSSTNSLASWVEVFNNKLPGITATIVGDQIELTSNLGTNNKANITIGGSSTLVTKGMFSVSIGLSSSGKASDFTLDRNTAQFQLAVPLIKGDKLSAGSADTEASIESTEFTGGTITLSSDAHVWLLFDTVGTIINTGAVSNTSLTVGDVTSDTISYTSISGSFANVLPGDYVIVWSPELNINNRTEGRVHSITDTSNPNDTINILITAAEYALVVPQTVTMAENGFVVVRTPLAPQKLRVQAGTKTLYQIAAELQTQTENATFSVYLQDYLLVTTNTLDNSGSLLVVTADSQGASLQFVTGTASQSQQTLIANLNTQNYAGSLPLFINSMFSDASANPIDSFISSITSSVNLSGTDPNQLIGILDPYNNGGPFNSLNGEFGDAQPYGEYVQETYISGGGTTIGITNDPYLRRVRSVDRFFLANPLDFGYNDTVVTILNNDVVNESFTIPLFRPALTYPGVATNPTNFDAYDVDSGPTAQFSTNFGSFDFANFKVLMQAKRVLVPPSNIEAAILYRSTPWGRSGEKITIAYGYPLSANQPLNSTVIVNDTVNIVILLSSGGVSPTAINSTTQWNVTISETNTPTGVDQVTFSWAGTYTFTVSSANATVGAVYQDSVNGQYFTVNSTIVAGTTLITNGLGDVPGASGTLTKISGTGDSIITYSSYAFSGFGTNPTLALSGGEFVNISPATGFNSANTGVFRVSTVVPPTPTSFTVQMPTGTAVIQSDILTQVNGGISFYLPASAQNTAANVVLYVNDNLSQYISAKLVGTGGIIVYSTSEDSGFTSPAIQLADGLNWIASSNLEANTITAVGTTVATQNVLTGVFPTDGIKNGASVSGSGIAGGTTVVSVNGSSVTISPAATGNFTSTGLTFVNTGTPQFVLKNPLTYSVEPVNPLFYSFNNGETIELVPTTMDQVKRFISIFAVSGFLSDGTITLSDRDKNLNLATQTLGSLGSIQITGGLGNEFVTPVLFSASLIDSTHMEVSANVVASQGIHDGEWLYLQAAVAQKKIINFSSNTDIQVITNTPTAGSSEIIATDRLLTQRNFGKARSISLTGLRFRVEKQGNLVCVTWTGSDPAGLTTSHLASDFSGSTSVTVTLVPNTTDAQMVTTTAGFFSDFSISDYITVSGLTANNDGTFLVTGISDDGKTIQITNSLATPDAGAATFTAILGVQEGDTVIFGSPFSPLNQGTFRVIRRFTDSFWIENPDVIEEEQTLTSTSLTFYEYEATVPGDKFVITGTVLGANNAGTYTITEVLNTNGGHYNDTIVISTTLTSIGPVNLTGFETALYVLEGISYTGYKQVDFVVSEPDSPTNNLIVFNTTGQYEKINAAGSVSMTSLNRLDYNTNIEIGLDSYRYNTGLIAEANRITYGDPRDSATYPGVSAAGADIFIKAPLVLRVQVSVEIRLQTGAPFTAISQQVQSNVASLINSNPVGQSIAISAIISSIMTVPGIISVAISSPLYNDANDLIVVAPSEKTLVIDQSVDVAVSQIGS